MNPQAVNVHPALVVTFPEPIVKAYNDYDRNYWRIYQKLYKAEVSFAKMEEKQNPSDIPKTLQIKIAFTPPLPGPVAVRTILGTIWNVLHILHTTILIDTYNIFVSCTACYNMIKTLR